MSEATRGRILIIEDVKMLGDGYKIFLERAGFSADIVKSKQGAISALRDRIYDLALVDLHLEGDDPTRPGGIEVMDEINRLGDGTKKIVVSASSDIRESVASFRRDIDDYIIKGGLGAVDITGPVERVLIDHKRCLYGPYKSLEQYLAAPNFSDDFQNSIHGILQCRYPDIADLSSKWLKKYEPLLRQKNGLPAFKFDFEHTTMTGVFWSKELGCAIWVSIGIDGNFSEPSEEFSSTRPQLIDEGRSKFSSQAITVRIWRIAADRSNFLDRITDLPGQRPEESASDQRN